MNSFIFNDAIRFKLATQQEDTKAKTQVFVGVLVRGLIFSSALGSGWLQLSLFFQAIGRRSKINPPVCGFGMRSLMEFPLIVFWEALSPRLLVVENNKNLLAYQRALAGSVTLRNTTL